MQRFIRLVVLVLLTGCPGLALADRYVAQAGQTPDPAGQYTDWSIAASNIQDAVTAAAVDDTVWVSNGTYTASSGSTVVSISKGLKVRGISGDPKDVVIDGGGVGSPKRGIVVGLSSPAYVMLDAVTVSNCFFNGHAAGLYLSVQPASGTAIVHNCIVTHNFSSNSIGNNNRGGGVYVLGTSGSAFEVVFSKCHILRNHTWRGSGAGLFLWGARVLIEDCLIEGNSNLSGADSSGGFTSTACPDLICRNTIIQHNTNNGTWAGGVEVRPGNVFENCIIRSNNAALAGGVLLRNVGSPPVVFRNCLIVGNTVRSGHGGMDFWGSTGILENCTIYNNGSPDVYARSNNNSKTHARLTVVNTIAKNFTVMAGSTVFATNSRANVISSWQGANNFTDDPQFVDEATMNFRLLKSSPCLNTGTNLPWMIGAVDLDGLPRIDTTGPGIVDRGSYEYPYRGTTIMVR